MRESKFRVWSNYWKKYATEAELHMDGSIDAIFEDADGVPHHENADLVVEFDTSLKDKNDKETYEGDIVQIDDHILGDFEVLWHNLGWTIRRSVGFETLSVHKSEDIVVIGNVHENFELLEGKEMSDKELDREEHISYVSQIYDEYLMLSEKRGASYGELAHIQSLNEKELDTLCDEAMQEIERLEAKK